MGALTRKDALAEAMERNGFTETRQPETPKAYLARLEQEKAASQIEAPRLTGGSNDYYKLPEGATELADLIEAKRMNFNVGNIFKAAYRLGEKQGNTLRYDLEKIIWFAERELARVED